MSSTGAQIAGSTAAGEAARDSVAQDWEAVRASGDIQFGPLPAAAPPPQPPAWLKAFEEFLRNLLEPVGRAIGLSWPAIQTVLIALAVLLVIFILWRLLGPLVARWRAREQTVEPEWAPDRDAAIALLEDADRLAGEGHFDEAVHLLLRRSVGHIADTRPDWLHPATTAREIATIPALPQRARDAFGQIAVRVERSLFALRRLEAGDWQEARAAYADFALADLK